MHTVHQFYCPLPTVSDLSACVKNSWFFILRKCCLLGGYSLVLRDRISCAWLYIFAEMYLQAILGDYQLSAIGRTRLNIFFILTSGVCTTSAGQGFLGHRGWGVDFSFGIGNIRHNRAIGSEWCFRSTDLDQVLQDSWLFLARLLLQESLRTFSLWETSHLSASKHEILQLPRKRAFLSLPLLLPHSVHGLISLPRHFVLHSPFFFLCPLKILPTFITSSEDTDIFISSCDLS